MNALKTVRAISLHLFFQIGYLNHYAGHHCSWCLDASSIRSKLLAAQKADTPRWGDYPEKLDLKYIQNLIDTGSFLT